MKIPEYEEHLKVIPRHVNGRKVKFYLSAFDVDCRSTGQQFRTYALRFNWRHRHFIDPHRLYEIAGRVLKHWTGLDVQAYTGCSVEGSRDYSE